MKQLLSDQPAFFAFMVTIVGLIGAAVLIGVGKAVPDAYWAITGGSGLGGLAALSPKALT